jgi:hypothetical protein
MNKYLLEQYQSSKGFRWMVYIFVLLSIWWLSIYLRHQTEGTENNIFTNLLLLFPLIGGVAGIYYSRLWGGLKSHFGKSIFLLSLGLFMNFIGNIIFLYYIYILNVEIPYPSWADVAFYASIILYIVGSYQLAKTVSLRFNSLSVFNKLLGALIPVIILLLSYLILMRDYDFATTTPLLIFLDFGWQIGQALYVSIALFIYWASTNVLGGLMRGPIVLLIAALVLQFIADFHFSYQIIQHTWYVGGTNDFLLMISYFLMTIAIFSIGNMFYKVKNS